MKIVQQVVVRVCVGALSLISGEPDAARAPVPDTLAVTAAPALSPRVQRALDLARREADFTENVVRLVRTYAEVFELLPLEHLCGVRVSPERVELLFDFDGEKTKRVKLPSSRCLVLDPASEKDPFAGGRLYRVEVEDHTLIVHRKVLFHLEDDEITGVREGDLEVPFGLFRFDLELKTFTEHGRMARDEDGRFVLRTDPCGRPLLDPEGNYLPEIHDHWVVLKAARRKVIMGVGSPQADGTGPLAVR